MITGRNSFCALEGALFIILEYDHMSDKTRITRRVPKRRRTERLLMGFDQLSHRVKKEPALRERLLYCSRLSRSETFHEIGIKNPSQADFHALFLYPSVYDAYRRLKYATEGIEYSGRQLATYIRPIVRKVAAAAESLAHKSPTALAQANEALYREICSSPYRTIIFLKAGLTDGRPQYWYWDDKALLERTTEFDSWADMQQRDSALRAHLAGRRLAEKAMRKNPRLMKHVRFGLNGHAYRSAAELVVGNLFAHNKLQVVRQYATGVCRARSNRQMIADFYFQNHKHIFEVTQTSGSGTGSRKTVYALRFRSKEVAYQENNISYSVIDSEPYFKNGVLQAPEFAMEVCRRLKSVGIDCGPVPDSSILLSEEEHKKEKWLSYPVGELLEVIAVMMGIVGVGILTNKFSWLHSIIRRRSDYDTVMQRLKAISKSISSEKRKRWIKRRDEGRPSLAVVRKLCREEEIRTQMQWFLFAKKNPGRLKNLGIPSNIYSVYTRLGKWISWRDVLASGPRTRTAFRETRRPPRLSSTRV